MDIGGGQIYLLYTRNGHGQCGWSPIGCEGLYFHSVKKGIGGTGKLVVPYRLRRFSHNFEHPKSTPYYFSRPLILSTTHHLNVGRHGMEQQHSWLVVERILEPPKTPKNMMASHAFSTPEQHQTPHNSP